MSQSAAFWDRIADRYAKRPIADAAAYEKKLDITREYLRPDMEVLEFGCGTGSTAILHAPFVKHIHAIDVSARMIEFARTKAAAQRVNNITFTQSSIDEFANAHKAFHAVLGLNILHLLEDRTAVIAKTWELLKPGGVFVSSTMCLGDNMRFIKLIVPIGRRLGLMPLVKVFTADALRGELADAGFAIDYEWQPGKGTGLFIVAQKPQ